MLVTLMLNNNLDIHLELEFRFAFYSYFQLFIIHTMSCLSCGFGIVLYFLVV